MIKKVMICLAIWKTVGKGTPTSMPKNWVIGWNRMIRGNSIMKCRAKMYFVHSHCSFVDGSFWSWILYLRKIEGRESAMIQGRLRVK